jgi:hypothetical protein
MKPIRTAIFDTGFMGPILGAGGATGEYPQCSDGLRQLRILKAALEGPRMRGSIDVPRLALRHLKSASERSAR